MRLIKKTIAECLRSRVRESADRVALEADEQRYTWKDLDTLSDYREPFTSVSNPTGICRCSRKYPQISQLTHGSFGVVVIYP